MAAYSVDQAKHATLSSTTQDTVTITGAADGSRVMIINRSGTETLSVRASRATSGPADITNLLEDDVDVVGPGGFIDIAPVMAEASRFNAIKVKVKGNANAYSVIASES